MSDARYPSLGLYIDGQWRRSGGAGEGEVFNPATGEMLAKLPLASDNDLAAAVDAARRGHAIWKCTPPGKRSAVIAQAVAIIREQVERIAVTMTLEQGKPLGESRLEVQRAAELIEWAAQEGRRTYGQTIPAPTGMRYLTFQEPIGVVAALTPWNFPAVSPARKIGSALAAGCACIVKPSEQTPGTAIALVEAFAEAGLPAGVLNLVFGEPGRVSSYLIDSPVVRMVTFTGSVPVGKRLASLAAERMKPCLMELGGHSPTIVFDDCDIAKIARACATTKFRNSGQVCTSPTRFFVQRSVYGEFVETFADAARRMTVGDGLSSATQMGPLASARRVDATEALANDAMAKGARAAAGGKRAGGAGRGYFFEPTVLSDVPLEARVMNEEPFGPIAACRAFDTVDDALREANGLPYGLAAYAFTSSLKNARDVAHGLECGIVGINSFSGSNPETPFGGVKDSGYGREGGVEGVKAYMTTKFVVEASL